MSQKSQLAPKHFHQRRRLPASVWSISAHMARPRWSGRPRSAHTSCLDARMQRLQSRLPCCASTPLHANRCNEACRISAVTFDNVLEALHRAIMVGATKVLHCSSIYRWAHSSSRSYFSCEVQRRRGLVVGNGVFCEALLSDAVRIDTPTICRGGSASRSLLASCSRSPRLLRASPASQPQHCRCVG